MAIHNEIGFIGEDVAAIWLKKAGYRIVERNYRRKWGEIDIVARGTDKKLHFVEVKSVSYETRYHLEYAVSPARPAGGHETYRPEDNVHKNKQDRLKRAIQTWVLDNSYTGDIVIDILTVRIVPREKYARVYLLEGVIFD